MAEKSVKSIGGDENAAHRHMLMELKRTKIGCKSAFTRAKNKLTNSIEKDDIDKQLVREMQSNLNRAQDELFTTHEKLCRFYQRIDDQDSEEAITEEIDLMDREYSECHRKVKEILDTTVNFKEHAVGKDMWKQLKRVSIPMFNGDKTKYESWKAAFMACIDSAPATPEYKLLQLRQYLEGDELKCIESLGHSEAAYDAAKQRLERKYGGKKRRYKCSWRNWTLFPS